MGDFYQSIIFVGDEPHFRSFLPSEFLKLLNTPTHSIIINRIPGKKSIGIAELKPIQSFAILKSYSKENKLILINEGEYLTEDAQNSLLKLLEEPPLNTLIVVRCNKYPDLLKTIFSRCNLVNYLEKEVQNDITIDGNFLKLPFYYRIQIINNIVNLKDTEIKNQQIEKLIALIAHQLMDELEDNISDRNQAQRIMDKLENLKNIKKKIKQNVNIKLSLDNIALLGETI